MFWYVSAHEVQSLEDLQYLQESVYEEMGLTLVERSKLNHFISTFHMSSVDAKGHSEKHSGTAVVKSV